MDKVLILYASFGEGHKRAALSLEDFFNTKAKDFLDFIPFPFLRKFYSYSYFFISERFPFFWDILFSITKINFFKKIVEYTQKILFINFSSFLKDKNSYTIITTHFFPLTFLSKVKKKFNLKIITIITDFLAHPFWINKDVDIYFVALKETKEDLIAKGINSKKIIEGFVPLRSGFFKDIQEQKIRERFALSSKPSLLFISSDRGKFPYLKEIILNLKDEFNFFIIYGKNFRLKLYLEKLKLPNIIFLPFYEEIWELFDISSIVISKPGGLTLFEGIYKKKPFIFTHYIPGQEEQNMKLLLKYNIAKYAKKSSEIIDSIHYFKNIYQDLKNSYPIVLKDIRKILTNILG